MSASYSNPVRCWIEAGAFARLPQILAEFNPKRILVVLGGQSFRRSAYYPELLEMLAPYEFFFSTPVAAC